MNDLNSILVEGNLARDPVMSVTPNGTSVCNMVVASHHLYKRQQDQRKDTSYFDVEAWARLGENCGEYLRKGRGVRVIGRLKQDRWKDGEGRPKSRVKIIAEHVEFRPVPRKDKNNSELGNSEDGLVPISDPGTGGDGIQAVAEGSEGSAGVDSGGDGAQAVVAGAEVAVAAAKEPQAGKKKKSSSAEKEDLLSIV